MKEYYDVAHARQRLSGCIVQLDNKYIRIQEVGGGPKKSVYQILYSNLGQDTLHVGYIPEQEVKTDNLLLGYVNMSWRKEAIPLWVTRYPARIYKDGLHPYNVHVEILKKGLSNPGILFTLEYEKHLVKTLKNKFPSYEETLKKDWVYGLAFSRSFVVDNRKQLIFRNKDVVGIAEKEPQLFDEFFYLKELLQQELH
jgi:hypothetical protein